MRVSGRATVAAPRADVFAAICDPGALLEIIPGCQEIRQVSADEYRGRIALRLPAIVGAWETLVRLTDSNPPEYGAFEGHVDGRMGSIAGSATFRLAEGEGGTVVEYRGEAVVSGPLARLDSMFVEGLAGSLVEQGLTRLDRRLRNLRAPVPGSAG